MATTKTKPTLLAARDSFVGSIDGETIHIDRGDLVESDHPIVKKWPSLFAAPRLRYPMVEQATAAPGEKRKR